MKIHASDLVTILTDARTSLMRPGAWRGYRRNRLALHCNVLDRNCACMWVHVDRQALAFASRNTRSPIEYFAFKEKLMVAATALLVRALPTDFIDTGPKHRPQSNIIWEWNDHSRRSRKEVEQVMLAAVDLARDWTP